MRAFALFVAALFALASPASAGNRSHTQMMLVQYDLTLYPDAVCNDGTAGACAIASGMHVRQR